LFGKPGESRSIARLWFERMRHVKLKPSSEISFSALEHLIHAAYENIHVLTARYPRK
jgi:hypothetical protein